MKKAIYLFAVMLLFTACSGGGSGKPDEISSTIAFDTVVVLEKVPLYPDGVNQEPHLEIGFELVVPSAYRSRDELKTLQQMFMDLAFGGEAALGVQGTIDKVIATWTEDYRSDVPELMESIRETEPDLEDADVRFMHQFFVDTNVEYVNDAVLSFSSITHIFTGLPRTFREKLFRTVNLNDMSIIQEEDLFKPGYEQPLMSVIYEKVVEKIKAEDPVLYSDPDELPAIDDLMGPNGNFCLTDRGLLYNYHPADVYMVITDLCNIFIPYSAVKPLLKPGVLKQYFGNDFEI